MSDKDTISRQAAQSYGSVQNVANWNWKIVISARTVVLT